VELNREFAQKVGAVKLPAHLMANLWTTEFVGMVRTTFGYMTSWLAIRV